MKLVIPWWVNWGAEKRLGNCRTGCTQPVHPPLQVTTCDIPEKARTRALLHKQCTTYTKNIALVLKEIHFILGKRAHFWTCRHVSLLGWKVMENSREQSHQHYKGKFAYLCTFNCYNHRIFFSPLPDTLFSLLPFFQQFRCLSQYLSLQCLSSSSSGWFTYKRVMSCGKNSLADQILSDIKWHLNDITSILCWAMSCSVTMHTVINSYASAPQL